jgi:hypothetical protein
MPFDLVGWDDAISGDELVGGEDFVSGDEDLRSLLAISGDDDFAISGAAKRRAVARKCKAISGMRRFPLGFTRPLVPSNTTNANVVDIQVNPQLPFRGERLIIPSNVANSFEILDLKVGNRSQFVTASPVPAVVFAENGFGVALRMDAARVSQDIHLTVRNITATTLDFRAALLGTAIY